jgi:hypothetical protein
LCRACSVLLMDHDDAQRALAQLWRQARDGILTPWTQAKAWALREVWKETHGDKTYGLLSHVASRLMQSGACGKFYMCPLVKGQVQKPVIRRPSAIHPPSTQRPSWSYFVHPNPKGSQNRWFGRPSPACEYPYYNIKKEGGHNVQNIRDTAQAAFDSRFLPKRCPNVASPRRVGEPHVQISNGMAYAVLMFRFLPRGDPNATRRRRGQNDLPGIGVP